MQYGYCNNKNLLSPKKKIFREINCLVISLVKPLLSRNFRQKSVTVNFRNFHTVCRKSESIMMMVFFKYLEIKVAFSL